MKKRFLTNPNEPRGTVYTLMVDLDTKTFVLMSAFLSHSPFHFSMSREKLSWSPGELGIVPAWGWLDNMDPRGDISKAVFAPFQM